MSAKGNCYDNAAMESFWSTLKTEAFPNSGVFESKEAARQAIFEYIEGYYHTQRMHSSLNYLTPLAAEMAAQSAVWKTNKNHLKNTPENGDKSTNRLYRNLRRLDNYLIVIAKEWIKPEKVHSMIHGRMRDQANAGAPS